MPAFSKSLYVTMLDLLTSGGFTGRTSAAIMMVYMHIVGMGKSSACGFCLHTQLEIAGCTCMHHVCHAGLLWNRSWAMLCPPAAPASASKTKLHRHSCSNAFLLIVAAALLQNSTHIRHHPGALSLSQSGSSNATSLTH